MEIQENDMLDEFGYIENFQDVNDFSIEQIEEIAKLFYQCNNMINDD